MPVVDRQAIDERGVAGQIAQDRRVGRDAVVAAVLGGHHDGQQLPVADGQVATVSKQVQGDAFRFTRGGGGSASAVYALAGAIHLARLAEAKPKRAPVFVL